MARRKNTKSKCKTEHEYVTSAVRSRKRKQDFREERRTRGGLGNEVERQSVNELLW